MLTWASCCPAWVDTCRSSSQSILFPRRRTTTPSDPESCTQNTFLQPHILNACCVPGPGWIWSCPPGSWPWASSSHTRPPFYVTLTPHPSHLDTFPSICSESAPPICLQACHPLSKANLKGTSSRKLSWIAPAHAPLFLTVLSSPVLDDTGCLGSFPNCFMDNNNNSSCLLSAYCIPGDVLKATLTSPL